MFIVDSQVHIWKEELQAVTRLATSGVAFLVASSLAFGQASTDDPDAQRKTDLVIAYKILVNEGILDGFGHVTVRSAKDPNIFFMPRAMPPSLVSL